MKERPILFSGPMVRAILEGKKTQTRRVVRPQPILKPCADEKVGHAWHWKKGRREAIWWEKIATPMSMLQHCPYGVPGDWLWVRETWGIGAEFDICKPSDVLSRMKSGKRPEVTYKADNPELMFYRWRPSIHMPRWASRLTLGVVEVRAERLQDISEDDARAEGVSPDGYIKARPVTYHEGEFQHTAFRDTFRGLWDSINAKRGFGWDVNPWIWVVSFKKNSP